MTLPKKIIISIVLTLALLIIPGVILLATVDATNDFAAYIVVYGFILFAMFSYLLISVHSLSKEIKNAVEEMKMQNAAIAYKITGKIKDEEIDDGLDLKEKKADTSKSSKNQKTNKSEK